MKLAFIHKRFGLDGGTERIMEGLTRGLADRGHEIDVYCGSVDPRFAQTRLARFHTLPVGGAGSFWKALTLMVSAALWVRRERFDAVLHFGRTGPQDIYRAGGGCHRTWFELLLSQAKDGWARLRLRCSLHHRLLLWHEQRALGGAGRVVVPSDRAREDLIEAYGALAEGVEVIPNGVDLDRFHPRGRQLFFEEVRADLGLRPEEVVLLFVGSDYWRKGLDTLLRAVAELGPRAEEMRVLVLGSDRRRERFIELAAELGVRDAVCFAGGHPHPERVYAACDVLVLPTRHDPFANVCLEALAAGLPVITSAVNGAVGEIGASPALAAIEDPEDHVQLAAAIERFVGAEGMLDRRGAARETAARCSESRAVGRWEQLLQSVAQERRGGG